MRQLCCFFLYLLFHTSHAICLAPESLEEEYAAATVVARLRPASACGVGSCYRTVWENDDYVPANTFEVFFVMEVLKGTFSGRLAVLVYLATDTGIRRQLPYEQDFLAFLEPVCEDDVWAMSECNPYNMLWEDLTTEQLDFLDPSSKNVPSQLMEHPTCPRYCNCQWFQILCQLWCCWQRLWSGGA